MGRQRMKFALRCYEKGSCWRLLNKGYSLISL